MYCRGIWSGVGIAALVAVGAARGQEAIEVQPASAAAQADAGVQVERRAGADSADRLDADIQLDAELPENAGQPPLPPSPDGTVESGSDPGIAAESDTAAGTPAPRPNRAAFGVTFQRDGADAMTIETVVPGSPAGRIGLERGDRIIAVNGESYADTQAFIAAAGDFAVDEEVDITYLRDGVEQSARVRLAAWSTVYGTDRAGTHRMMRPSFDDGADEAPIGSQEAMSPAHAAPYCPVPVYDGRYYGRRTWWDRFDDDECDD